MPGQGPLWCGVDLRDGGEGVPGLGVVELPLDAALLDSAPPAPEPEAPSLAPVLEAFELDAAEAPVMPEAAPPAASAPATIVAPSILDMFIGRNLLEKSAEWTRLSSPSPLRRREGVPKHLRRRV
jgi:hypothetical protein